MPRRYCRTRPPTRAERLDRWQRFLNACSDEERAEALALQERLRDGYLAHCEERGSHHHFGIDSSAELLVALMDWIQMVDRTSQVRKGVQK